MESGILEQLRAIEPLILIFVTFIYVVTVVIMRKRILALQRAIETPSGSAQPRTQPRPKSRVFLGFLLCSVAVCAGVGLWQGDFPELNQYGLRMSLGIASAMLFLMGAMMFLTPFFRWFGNLSLTPFGVFLFFLGCGFWAWLYYDDTLSKSVTHLLGWTNTALVLVGALATFGGDKKDLTIRTAFTGGD